MPKSDRVAPASHDDRGYAAESGALQMLFVGAQAMQPLYQILVARLFGAAVYGLYGGALSILEVLTRVAVFGGDKTMYRFVGAHHEAGERDAEAEALGSGIRTTLAAGTLIAVAMLVASSPVARLFGKSAVAPFLRALSPAVPAAALTITVVAACLAARASRAPLVVRGIVEPFALVVAALVACAIGRGWTSLAVAHSAAVVVTAAVAIHFAAGVFDARKLARAARRRSRHVQLGGFARSVVVLETVNTLRQQADCLLVVAFLPLEAAALYKASDYVGRVAAQIRNAFDGVAAPLFAGPLHVNDRSRLHDNLRFLTRWVATLTLPLGCALIALRRPILALFGPAYVAAAGIVVVHVVGHMANGIFGLCGYVLMMSGKTRWLTANQLVALAANVAVCAWAIPAFGLFGAALGFAAAMLIVVGANVTETFVLERVSPFHRALAKPFVAAAACLAVEIALARLPAPPLVLIPGTLVAGSVVYVVIWWALRPPAEERAWVERLVARARRA
jgi:O-antigen/teichoic acid export membrane protein